jgi:hypothetical protein
MKITIIILPKGQRLIRQAYETFRGAGDPSKSFEAEIECRERQQLEFECDSGEGPFYFDE